MKISLFNLLILSIAVGLFLYFIVFTYLQAVEFSKQDPPKKKILA